jgi:zinc/manganese transport system substrate-binding protein
MHTRLFSLLGLALGFASLDAAARPLIVTTLPDLAAVARAVGGDDVEVRGLVEPTEDPHYVDPRPSFVLTLSKADVLLYNGLELEVGWLPPLLLNARNPQVQLGGIGHIDASSIAGTLERHHVGKVDRAMGDIHPGGNPHYTWSPRALGHIARGLASRLVLLDPARASAYVERADKLVASLRALEQSVRARFDALPNRQVVVYHDSLVYLVKWLGLEQVATVEHKPGIRPSPGHVADVLKLMKARGVKVILQEAWHPDSPSDTLASLSSGRLLRLNGGTRSNQTLISHLEEVTNAIHDALSRP